MLVTSTWHRWPVRTMAELGHLPMGGGPGEMTDLQHRDLATMEQLVRVTGASAD